MGNAGPTIGGSPGNYFLPFFLIQKWSRCQAFFWGKKNMILSPQCWFLKSRDGVGIAAALNLCFLVFPGLGSWVSSALSFNVWQM